MKTPDRSYLAAQNENLIQAGDRLVTLIDVILFECGEDDDLNKAIASWQQAKENPMGLARR